LVGGGKVGHELAARDVRKRDREFWRVVNDNGSIWTQWVNFRYLRRHSIWVANIPSDCS
jgi:hypothetical protein